MNRAQADPILVLKIGLVVTIVAAGALAASLVIVLSEDQRKRDGTLREDVKLLEEVMNKLAGASEDKGLTLIANLFSAVALIATTDPVKTAIDRQWDLLCRNPGSQSLFDAVAFGIQLSYDTVCERYQDLLGFSQDLSGGTIGVDHFQNGFNLLIMALIDLDNAIASDP